MRVAFLGGNGHCAARLAAARPFASDLELDDVPYPGFEGRPRAGDLASFLDAVATSIAEPPLVYATGIGGLLALALRARGALDGTPLVLQAPVLWGLERRLMPRLMRWRPAQRLVHRVFAARAFQARFVCRHFTRPLPAGLRTAFFEGYARCDALPDMFAWLTPPLLRRLERELVGRPGALDRITVWWGRQDRVIGSGELRFTRQALGVDWPLRTFPGWGHYPMLDEPEAWVAELRAVTLSRE